jgi:hypothetical protein
MRWFHSGIDGLYAALAHGLIPPLFRHGHASPPLRDHLAAVELQVPPLVANGRYTLTARTLAGDVRAGFRLRLGSRPALPVLIYHHGLGEMPFDRTFRFIFGRRVPVEAHLVAVRAPFHRSHLDCCRGLATLNRFLAMCAVSVTLVETLRSALAARGAQGCLVAGTSLGGFVTLLHHLTFGTASGYAPLLAGPDLAYTLLATPFRRFVARQARAQSAHLSARLDFRQDFRAGDMRRVFPLLAQHDLCMPCAHHRAEYAASGIPVTTIGRGHLTGSLAFAALRAHLLTCLARLAPDEPDRRSVMALRQA